VDPDAVDRAVARGVEGLRRLQGPDGTWPLHPEGNPRQLGMLAVGATWPAAQVGATALAGLTLLECGVPANDKAVTRAADVVRQASVTLTHNYTLSLSILFLDRLGEPADIPLIESMTVRLLAGQTSNGSWSYDSPPLSDAEVRRLTTLLRQRTELVGRRGLPGNQPGRRTPQDLPREIQDQLAQLNRIGPGGINRPPAGDHSNTQFVVLALWVARRHGLPVDPALSRVGAHFRAVQYPDGGWGYFDLPHGPSIGPKGGRGGGRGGGIGQGSIAHGQTDTMTCAGLLGLAVAHGVAADTARAGGPRRPTVDVSKDLQLRKGLLALSTSIRRPVGQGGRVQRVGGRAYYFFWSLERVAVALGLDTINKKDWYAWGAEILLANQQGDGTWQGRYGQSGADTCFALLFLKRANLARDLTASLRGKLKDPSEKVLRSGGVGGEGLGGALATRLESSLDPESKDPDKPAPDKPAPDRPNLDRPNLDKLTPNKPAPDNPLPTVREPKDPPPAPRAAVSAPADSEATRLSGALVQAPAARQGALLESLRDGKGVVYTEALAAAIPQLTGEAQDKTRAALAERLTRMKATTLAKYFEDEDAEVRRAAALACAMKDGKDLVPGLIRLLSDREPLVERAAHAALKELTGQDFGPAAGASRADRARAVAAWKVWWNKQNQ
jgi:hypothetical protein